MPFSLDSSLANFHLNLKRSQPKKGCLHLSFPFYLHLLSVLKLKLKLPFTIVALLACTAISAQTTKGNFLLGGSADASLSFNSTTRGFNVSLQPTFAAFVVKNFAVGVVYAFGISGSHVVNTNPPSTKETNNFNTSLGPYLKYYIGKKGLRGAISANGGLAISTGVRTETNRSPSQAYEGFFVGGSLGLAYFFNEHISLEPALYINTTGYQTLLPTTRGGFSLGLFAFLEKKKPAAPKP